MHKLTIRFAALAVTVIALSAAQAANYRWLENSPIRHFTQQDHEMARANMAKALDEGQVGEELSWENPASDARGSATVLSDYTKDDLNCRRIRVHNVAKTLEGSTSYGLCKHPEAGWKLDQ